MVLAMVKLKPPVFCHRPVPVSGGTIQANAGGSQVIHAQCVVIQRTLRKRSSRHRRSEPPARPPGGRH